MIPTRIEKIHKITFGVDLKKENLRGFIEAIISLDVLAERLSENEKKIIERMILRLYEFLEIRCDVIRNRKNNIEVVKKMDIMLDGNLFRGKISIVSKVDGGMFLNFKDSIEKSRGHIFLNNADLKVVKSYLKPEEKKGLGNNKSVV